MPTFLTLMKNVKNAAITTKLLPTPQRQHHHCRHHAHLNTLTILLGLSCTCSKYLRPQITRRQPLRKDMEGQQCNAYALFNDGVVVLVDFVGVHLVEQALSHERAGIVLPVNPVTLTRHVVVNTAANIGHVRALSQVVAHHACSQRHAAHITREGQPGPPAYLVVQIST